MSISKFPGHMQSTKLILSATVLTLGQKAKIFGNFRLYYRRLHLPTNARAKNMFSCDVKRLCFECQTSNFPCPHLSLRDLKRLCFRCQTLKFPCPNVVLNAFTHLRISDFRRFFLRFLDCNDCKLSEPREHRLCRENYTFGWENFKV